MALIDLPRPAFEQDGGLLYTTGGTAFKLSIRVHIKSQEPITTLDYVGAAFLCRVLILEEGDRAVSSSGFRSAPDLLIDDTVMVEMEADSCASQSQLRPWTDSQHFLNAIERHSVRFVGS